jgi:hypothetical protein
MRAILTWTLLVALSAGCAVEPSLGEPAASDLPAIESTHADQDGLWTGCAPSAKHVLATLVGAGLCAVFVVGSVTPAAEFSIPTAVVTCSVAVWGVVDGTSHVLGCKSQILLREARAPIPGLAVTVNCNDHDRSLREQCFASSIRDIPTPYSEFFGRRWNCGEVWARPDIDAPRSRVMCASAVELCVRDTALTCVVNGIARRDVPAALLRGLRL